MVSFLARWFVPKNKPMTDPEVRKQYGILCGGVGIFLNVLLFGGKLLAGLLSGSIAITADAFNNLSDAGSSIVSMLGFHLAGQKPDRDHPFGHGRIEYVSGLIVAMLIGLMGVELLKSGVDAILHPAAIAFDWLMVGILAASMVVKLYMFSYNRIIGKKIQSAAMEATATDSLSDVCATGAVLLSTLVSVFTPLQIDGYCGVIVALLILYAGYQAAVDTVNPLLGQPPEPEFVRKVISLVLRHPEIVGVHDLIVHDYGPGRLMITLHAEVPATGNLLKLHDTVDNVEKELENTLGCLATIHMDPVSNDEETREIRQRLAGMMQEIEEGMTIHDFRMVKGDSHTNLIFDALLPHETKRPDSEIREEIRRRVRAMEGNYYAVVKVEKGYL